MSSTPIESPSPMVRWWLSLGRAQQLVLALVAVVVAANVGLMGLRSAIGGGSPGGPTSSSFSTGADGFEAWADLLVASDRAVIRRRDRVEPGVLPSGATVVLADPAALNPDEARVMLDAVVDGARLVLVGSDTAPLLEVAVGGPVEVTQVDPAPLLTAVHGSEAVIGSARSVAGDRGGRWRVADTVHVHLEDEQGRPAVLSVTLGDGEVVAVADSAPLQNRNLAKADNAALALGLAGPGSAPVVFVESAHGFASGGLDAVPSSWKWAAGVGALTLVLGLWWAGTRFGPAEPHQRELRPPRIDHVRAVAADIDRVSRNPGDLVETQLQTNRQLMADRLGVDASADAAELDAAARRLGVDAGLVSSVCSMPADLTEALAVGEFAAHHHRAVMRGDQSRPVVVAPAGDLESASRSTGTVPVN